MTGPLVVLVGAPCVGKSAAGRLAATQLGCPYLDADDLADDIHSRLSWTPERFAELRLTQGADAAYADFENVAVQVALEALHRAGDAVLTLGPGHVHFRNAEHHATIATALGAATGRVVLLIAHEDGDTALEILRDRARSERHDTFIRGTRDLLREWVRSPQLRSVATTVVNTFGHSPEESATDIARLVGFG